MSNLVSLNNHRMVKVKLNHWSLKKIKITKMTPLPFLITYSSAFSPPNDPHQQQWRKEKRI